jgi:hypothetical protein
MQSPSSEANTHSVTQKITILWNTEAHYSNQKGPSLVSILSQMNPIHPPHQISSTLSMPQADQIGLPYLH